MGEAGAFGLFLAVGATLVSLLLGPVGQAMARRIGGRAPGEAGMTTGEMSAERVAELEARVAELEAAHARLVELEDRVDFAERLLARPPDDPGRLGRGSPGAAKPSSGTGS